MKGGEEDFGQGGGIVGVANELSAGEGKEEILAFTVRQRKGLTPVICVVGLGENEGVRLHVRGPSFAHGHDIPILPEMFCGAKTPEYSFLCAVHAGISAARGALHTRAVCNYLLVNGYCVSFASSTLFLPIWDVQR